MPAVTVVVPTLNEAGNIDPLVRQIAAAFGSRCDWEILIVDDDSKDGTAAVAGKMAPEFPVRAIVRRGERGLATAVMMGIASTESAVVAVMDADLSHPPTIVPKLVEAVEKGAEVAIGSRYVAGGGTEGWSGTRLAMSRLATLPARGLTSAGDPMAGFFALRRNLLDGVTLRPRGFKILLEILARARPAKVAEIPIHFAPRHAGASKMSAKVTIEYGRQLMSLYASRPAAQVMLVIFLATLVKGFVSFFVELNSIEAYHWMYGRHPALGYYDHPAMIGWMSWLSTTVFGHSPLGVRMVTILASGLSAWLTFLAGRKLYDERTGRLAGMLVALVPMTVAYGMAATPDAPLLLFWSATLWALAHAMTGSKFAWYGAGVFLGLAMLSKYHAIFIALGTFAFLVLSREHRAWLRRPQPYVAVLIGLVATSPTLIWNAQHDWQSIAYQAVGRFRESKGFDPKELVDFARSQLLLLTPFVALWVWGSGLRKPACWQDRLTALLGMPVLIFFVAMTLVRSVRGHWPAPGYMTTLVLAAAVVMRGGPWGRRLFTGTLVVLGIAGIGAMAVVPSIPPKWKMLGDEVRKLSPDFVLARDYHDAAQMAYQLRPVTACDFTAVGNEAKSFRNWWDPKPFIGRDAIVVYTEEDYRRTSRIDLVEKCFEKLDPPIEVSVPRFRDKPEKFLLIRARNYLRAK